MDGISIELQALEKENTKLSFDTQIGEIKVATGLLIRLRPTFLCAQLSIIARANVQRSTDWRRSVIFRRIRAAHPTRVSLIRNFIFFHSPQSCSPPPSPRYCLSSSFLLFRLVFCSRKIIPGFCPRIRRKWWTDNEGNGIVYIWGVQRRCVYIYNISIFRVFCELELNEIKETRNESGWIMSN